MKQLLLLLLLPCCAFGQQIELAGGMHFLGDGKKPVYGLNVKNISGPWGAYASWYHLSEVNRGTSTILHTASPGQPTDSTVAITPMMPHGFTVGACYTFSFGLSVFAGGGLSINREARSVFTNYYEQSSGYQNLDHQTSSETYRVTSKKLSFELQADFDLLPKSPFAIGPRIGYNTQNGFTGQLFIGFRFKKNNG